MYLTIKGMANGGRIPRKYTQDAQGAVKDMSPPIEWYNVPEGTVTLALIMEDPEAPDPNDPAPNPWVHWVVVNIPATMKGLPEGFTTKEVDDEDDELSQIQEGHNDFKVPSYRGPNPPIGEHRYEFQLYALDTKLKVPKKPSRDRVRDAMEGHILAEAMFVGVYGHDNSRPGHENGFMPPGLGHLAGPGRPETMHNTHNPMGQIHGR